MIPDDLRLYILMRNDLPSMNAGKAMAQASHASNQFWKKCNSEPDAQEWASLTDGGFGTVLVLSASLDQINDVKSILTGLEFTKSFGSVVDPTYPYIVSKEIVELIDPKIHTSLPKSIDNKNFVCFRKEVTCFYVFGGAEQLRSIIGHLSLHE